VFSLFTGLARVRLETCQTQSRSPNEDPRKEGRVEQGGEVRGDQPGEEVRVGDQLPGGGREGEPEGGDQGPVEEKHSVKRGHSEQGMLQARCMYFAMHT
jgi:hypothetical protein